MIHAARRVSEAGARFRRLFSSDIDPKSILERWLRGWTASSPVEPPFDGASPPTALAWARRHGPALPEATLRRLFREQAIRAWDPVTDQVRRIKDASAVLPKGARLLFPKSPSPLTAAPAGSPSRPSHHPSPAQQARIEEFTRLLRSSILVERPDLGFIAVNKPAGLAVQGGTGVDLSLDQLLPAAFPEYWEDIPTGKKALAAFKSGGGDQRLKLTHRLDRQVTGVLLLGVGIDGAARLGTAFSGKSLAASGGGGPRQAAAGAAVPQVHKVYWAVVCRENEEDDKIEGFRLKKGESGSIEAALGGGGGTPALTRLRVLETSADGALAWLELEPVTGRKHQLRQHAATELGAPILGDGRYGLLRKGHQRLILKDLADNLGQKKSDETPLLLHCRRMEVRVPGRPPAAASAPLPPAWTALLHAQGWPLPDDS